MDSIVSVLGRESAGDGFILLYKEGVFYKAYEYSAYRLVRFLKPYKVKKYHYKAAGCDVCSAGFPVSALEDVAGGRAVDFREDGTVCISGDFARVDETVFGEWKNSVPLSEARRRNGPAAEERSGIQATSDVSDAGREVLERLRKFSLESESPIACMLLVAELKKLLNG